MKLDLKTENVIIDETVKLNTATYRYKLIRFNEKSVSSFGIDLYEIYVETESEGTVVYYRSGGIFTSPEKAKRFLKKLKENLATPRNTPYVIDDSLSF